MLSISHARKSAHRKILAASGNICGICLSHRGEAIKSPGTFKWRQTNQSTRHYICYLKIIMQLQFYFFLLPPLPLLFLKNSFRIPVLEEKVGQIEKDKTISYKKFPRFL